jgi:hypothetical protein
MEYHLTNANRQKHVEEMRARIEARLAERNATASENAPNPKKKMSLKAKRELERKKRMATAKQKKLMSKPLVGTNMNTTANGRITNAKLQKLKTKLRTAQNKRASAIASKYTSRNT